MTRLEANHKILKELEKLINRFPDQRFGQIMENYVFANFYEESTLTLEELIKSNESLEKAE